VKNDQIFEAIDGKWDADGDANGPYREQFDHSFQLNGPVRAHTFKVGQTDHLRFVEKDVPGAALAGTKGVGLSLLAEEILDRLPGHLIGHVKGVHEDDFATIAFFKVAFGLKWART
jgi:hypothetical protein